MLSYLWKRNRTYCSIKIPVELSSLFPVQLIRISLKANDTDAAKVSAANVHRQVLNYFALLGSGAVDADLASGLVEAIMSGTKRFKVVKVEEGTNTGPAFSQMIQEYIADRSPRWAEKTKLEFRCPSASCPGRFVDWVFFMTIVNGLATKDIINCVMVP
ncbi:MAG TPA: DUF6538 domain-containing protein [Desulfuromonadales bacterium]|nr:DUF6538 domain-containing protein [Desulfuromonadales bacterium]